VANSQQIPIREKCANLPANLVNYNTSALTDHTRLGQKVYGAVTVGPAMIAAQVTAMIRWYSIAVLITSRLSLPHPSHSCETRRGHIQTGGPAPRYDPARLRMLMGVSTVVLTVKSLHSVRCRRFRFRYVLHPFAAKYSHWMWH
jgi:hypothetical protein